MVLCGSKNPNKQKNKTKEQRRKNGADNIVRFGKLEENHKKNKE
jgi:hypothetical protein